MSLSQQAFKHAADATPVKKFAKQAADTRIKLIEEIANFSSDLGKLKIKGFSTSNEDGGQDNHNSTDYVNLAVTRDGTKKPIATIRLSKIEDNIQIDNLDVSDRVFIKDRDFTYAAYAALTDSLSGAMVSDLDEADVEKITASRAKDAAQGGPEVYGPKA